MLRRSSRNKPAATSEPVKVSVVEEKKRKRTNGAAGEREVEEAGAEKKIKNDNANSSKEKVANGVDKEVKVVVLDIGEISEEFQPIELDIT